MTNQQLDVTEIVMSKTFVKSEPEPDMWYPAYYHKTETIHSKVYEGHIPKPLSLGKVYTKKELDNLWTPMSQAKKSWIESHLPHLDKQ